MIETILGVIFSIWTVGIVAVFTFWLVHEDSEGWAIFWLIVGAGLAYFTFEVDGKTLLMYIAAYIPVGLVWSFFRWKRYCNRKVDKFNDFKQMCTAEGSDVSFDEKRRLEALRKEVDPTNNISKVVQWIIIWPFSLIDNILGDVYDMLVNLVRKHLISLYRRISDGALKKVQ